YCARSFFARPYGVFGKSFSLRYRMDNSSGPNRPDTLSDLPSTRLEVFMISRVGAALGVVLSLGGMAFYITNIAIPAIQEQGVWAAPTECFASALWLLPASVAAREIFRRGPPPAPSDTEARQAPSPVENKGRKWFFGAQFSPV